MGKRPNRRETELAIELTRPERGDFLEEAEARALGALVPGRPAREDERVVLGHEQTPAEGRFRFVHELVRRDEKEEIRASVTGDFFKLSPVAQLPLERDELARDPGITTMLKSTKIGRVPFREKGLAGAQGGVVHAQMPLEDLPAAIDRGEPRERFRTATGVAPEVGRTLLALEDHGHAEAVTFRRAIGRDVGAVPAFRERNFERRDRVTILLRPKQREAFELAMGGGLAPPVIPSGAQRSRGIPSGFLQAFVRNLHGSAAGSLDFASGSAPDDDLA